MHKVRGTGKVIADMKTLPQVAVLPRFLFPVLLATMFVLPGCVTTQEAADNRNALGQLQVRVYNLEKEVGQTNLPALKESQSTILSQTTDYSKELQELKGRFDENKYSHDKSIKDMMSELELMKARIAALETRNRETNGSRSDIKDSGKISGDAPQKSPGPKNRSAAKESISPAKLYDEAHIAMKGKRFGEARKMFERFTKDYPKEGLTSNAYFWIGETYYSEKKYEDAILAYEDFLKKYPRHDKVRSAMLKQGYSFMELGGKNNRLAGRDILEALVEKYPKSKEAALAQKKIKEISKSTPKAKKKG
jgi:tol-pal system protein YbgF